MYDELSVSLDQIRSQGFVQLWPIADDLSNLLVRKQILTTQSQTKPPNGTVVACLGSL